MRWGWHGGNFPWNDFRWTILLPETVSLRSQQNRLINTMPDMIQGHRLISNISTRLSPANTCTTVGTKPRLLRLHGYCMMTSIDIMWCIQQTDCKSRTTVIVIAADIVTTGNTSVCFPLSLPLYQLQYICHATYTHTHTLGFCYCAMHIVQSAVLH